MQVTFSLDEKTRILLSEEVARRGISENQALTEAIEMYHGKVMNQEQHTEE